MKKLLLSFSLVLSIAAVALVAEARPQLCSQIERCFGSNDCIDALVDAELLDTALLYYGDNCVGRTIDV